NVTRHEPGTLWTQPKDIASLDLYYGHGGKGHQPVPPFTFLKEDLEGTNPKFDVQDANGQKWRAKLGREAQPETAASRFVWAAGFFVSDEYLMPEFRVAGMPPRLSRGHQYVGAGGVMHNVRLKRHAKEEKLGEWEWLDNPFNGSRELN